MTKKFAPLKPGPRGIHELVFEELQSVVGQVKLHKIFKFYPIKRHTEDFLFA